MSRLAEFQRLNILLLRAVTGKMIGTALLTEVKVHSTSRPSNADVQTTVSGSLGGLQIMNLLTGSTLHQKIFSVGRDPVAEDYSRSDHKLDSILLTFQNQGMVLKSALSTNTQSRFLSPIFDSIFGHHCPTRHTLQIMSLILFLDSPSRQINDFFYKK